MTPLTIRYNNPGALEYQPWMAKYGASLGDNGRYAAFASPDAGYQVMGKVLDTYQNKHGLNTVSGIVNRWAPASVDNNSTGTYTQKVAGSLGIDPNAPISPAQRPALMQAMASYEAGRPAPMPGQSAPTGVAQGSFRAAQEQSPRQETPPMQPMGFMPQLDPAMMQQMPQPQAQQGGFGGFLQNMTSNPLFMMGAGVLGGQNVGQGLMGGMQMAQATQQQAYDRQRQQAADQRTNAMHPLQMQLMEAQIKKAGEPATSEDIREFEYAKKGGFSGGFEQWMNNKRAQANGGLYGQNGQVIQDKDGTQFAMQFGRDGSLKVQPITAPGGGALTQAKGVEKVGDSLINKSTGQEVRAIGANIAGEQTAKEVGEVKGKFIAALPKHEATISSMASQDKLMGQEIARSVDLIDKGGVTSWMGSVAKYAPGTAAYELSNRIKTIKANIGFDRLQQMRAESPTGGALGAIAVQELESLQSVLGSFDQAQGAQTLKGNLSRLNEMLATRATRLKSMLDQDKARFGTSAPGLTQAGPAAQTAPPSAAGKTMRWNPETGQLEPQ